MAEIDETHGYRVIYQTPWVRLLLWVHPHELRDVITQRVLVHLEPEPQPLSTDLLTGVEALPGCAMTMNGRTSLWSDVSSGDWRFHFRGWVAETAFGKTYRATASSEPFVANARVEPSTEIYASPWGYFLGAFTRRDRHPVRIMGTDRQGMVPIRYCNGDFQVTGYVESDRIQLDPQARPGNGAGRSFARDAVLLRLPRGTLLYGSPDGEIAGVVSEDSHEVVGEARDGWWHLPALSTPWRDFEVWVADEGPADRADDSGSSARIIHRNLQRCEL